MKKIIGYILALAGIVGIAMSQVPQIKQALPALPTQISDTTLMIISIVVAIIGFFLIFKARGGQKSSEVPILQGKSVVGYRQN